MIFYQPAKEGLRLRIRLTPSGPGNRVLGVMQNENGDCVLKVSVTQVPEGGKANLALIKLLAKEWKLAKSALSVLQGATSRQKVLHLSGSTTDLSQMLTSWAAQKGLST